MSNKDCMQWNHLYQKWNVNMNTNPNGIYLKHYLWIGYRILQMRKRYYYSVISIFILIMDDIDNNKQHQIMVETIPQ